MPEFCFNAENFADRVPGLKVTYLVGARQLQFETQKLLDRSHGDSAGAADEPLHQILSETSSVRARRVASGQREDRDAGLP